MGTRPRTITETGETVTDNDTDHRHVLNQSHIKHVVYGDYQRATASQTLHAFDETFCGKLLEYPVFQLDRRTCPHCAGNCQLIKHGILETSFEQSHHENNDALSEEYV